MKMKNLNQLIERVKQDDSSKYDFRILGKDLTMTNNGTIVRKQHAGKEGLQFSEYAFTQLLNRYGLPVKETKTTLRYNPEHVYRLVNELLNADDNEMLLRARVINGKGIVRAILSKDYSVLNNSEILRTVQQNLDDTKLEHKVETSYLDDGRLHLRVTFDPTTQAFGKDILGTDDIIRSGVDIINSETGRSSFRMEPMVFRQVCTNGLKAWKHDENNESISQRHIFISTKELNDMVIKGITGSIDTAQNVLNTFEDTKKIIVMNPVKEIKRLCEDQKLSQKLTATIIKSYNQEPVRSRYGIINAFTRGARGLGNVQRLQLETFAGRLMTDESLYSKVA